MVPCIIFAADYIEPLPIDSYAVTSDYGERVNPVTYENQFHYGIDLGAPEGTNVYATTNGEIQIGFDEINGNWIRVVESLGNYTHYLHLSEILVSNGITVTQGTTIGKVGSTGRSTGPHLHYEVIINDVKVNPNSVTTFTASPTIPTNLYPINLFGNGMHKTGMIDMYLDGYLPYTIYKSNNNVDWSYLATSNTNKFTEYGLTNGITYYYKLVDRYGRDAYFRYTPPITELTIYPITVIKLADDYVHLRWNEFFDSMNLYLDDVLLITFTYGISEYTITGLESDTEYQIHGINSYGERSNTIKIHTSKDINNLEDLLKKIFEPVSGIDTNADGVPDYAQDIKDAIEQMKNKLTGGVFDDMQDTLTGRNLPQGSEASAGIPKIETVFMGINIKVFDITMEEFNPWIDFIRLLVLAFLVVGFIYAIISIFDVQFKV